MNQNQQGALLGGAILLIICMAIFALPTFIAFGRHKRNRWPIAMLNWLLGFTVIGWVAALIWALCYEENTRSTGKGIGKMLIDVDGKK